MKMNQGNIKFLVSIMVLLAGITMGFLSLYIPPQGIIDASVLTFVGEILTFVGAVWGIGQYASIQIAKFKGSVGSE